jgi:hypothetical protein
MTKLSKRSLTLLAALEDRPMPAAHWIAESLSDTLMRRKDVATRLERLGLVLRTEGDTELLVLLTLKGRIALEKARLT